MSKPNRNRSRRRSSRQEVVHHPEPLDLLEGVPITDASRLFADAPEIFQRLVHLPISRQLERLDEYLDELGEYRTASGALDLQPQDRYQLQSLIDRRHASDEEVFRLGLGDVTERSLLLTLPQMIRLYRFLANQEYSPTVDRIRRSTLTSIARNITAARYFKAFDEKHML